MALAAAASRSPEGLRPPRGRRVRPTDPRSPITTEGSDPDPGYGDVDPPDIHECRQPRSGWSGRRAPGPSGRISRNIETRPLSTGKRQRPGRDELTPPASSNKTVVSRRGEAVGRVLPDRNFGGWRDRPSRALGGAEVPALESLREIVGEARRPATSSTSAPVPSGRSQTGAAVGPEHPHEPRPLGDRRCPRRAGGPARRGAGPRGAASPSAGAPWCRRRSSTPPRPRRAASSASRRRWPARAPPPCWRRGRGCRRSSTRSRRGR